MTETAINLELKRINDKIKHIETVIGAAAKTGSLGMLERSRQIRGEILREFSLIQEQRDTAVEALKRITEIPDHEEYFDDEERLYSIKECAKQALAEIGGEDE